MKQIKELQKDGDVGIDVRELGKEDKAKLQKFLFKHGYAWGKTEKKVKYNSGRSQAYFISKRGCLTYLTSDPEYWCEEHGYPLLSIKEFGKLTDFKLPEILISQNYSI